MEMKYVVPDKAQIQSPDGIIWRDFSHLFAAHLQNHENALQCHETAESSHKDCLPGNLPVALRNVQN